MVYDCMEQVSSLPKAKRGGLYTIQVRYERVGGNGEEMWSHGDVQQSELKGRMESTGSKGEGNRKLTKRKERPKNVKLRLRRCVVQRKGSTSKATRVLLS